MKERLTINLSALLLAWSFNGAALAQQAASSDIDQGTSSVIQPTGTPPATKATDASLGEIVVTAQKRTQNVNDVGMSISALSADDLRARGVESVEDLAKVVTGFEYASTSFSNPVYSIRGVGFYEPSLAVTPAVTVYVDEVPLPYPAMTSHADLDVERVEVLKGPQGTVFGQNATGGAVNYIAAKPTDQFAAGYDVSYERFNLTRIDGFVSGPLSDTLNARVAIRAISGGAWQESEVSKDTLGNQSLAQGRILLDFHPTDKLSFLLNFNSWLDKSDPQAVQVTKYMPANPSNPNVAVVDQYPHTPPPSARDADWLAGFPQRNNDFYQLGLRSNYGISDDLSLTAITAFSHFKEFEQNDTGGFPVAVINAILSGGITSFSQELRLAGHTNRFNWLVGADYEHDLSTDDQQTYNPYSSDNPTFPGLPITNLLASVDGTAQTFAGFAHGEYEIVDGVTLQAGARYTDDRRQAVACASGVDGSSASVSETFNDLQQLLKGSVIPIPPGGCVTFNANNNPAGVINQTLHQNNVSWRGGIDWKVTPDDLLYANVSRGYKAGAFPTTFWTSTASAQFVPQESLTAYETGFKTSFFDRRAQLNGATFYYNYLDKQLHSKVDNLVFGPVDSLVVIPKSRVWGAELQLNAVPVRGLDVNLGATYLQSKILGTFLTYPQYGPQVNVGGNPFPYTPNFSIVGDSQYRWDIRDHLSLFVGGGFTSNSRTTGDIGNGSLFEIRPYTVVDARAGVIGPDDKWRLSFYGKNIFNIYYWTSSYFFSADEAVRQAALPATFGVSFSMRY
jgi:iron complex outermembrane recepter protein